MVSALLSGVLGLVRSSLIAYFFGASPAVDAYTGAFELPDTINYLLIGGVASTTFIKLLTQYEAEGRLEEGDRALSNILNVMLTVLAAAALLGMVIAPIYVKYKFHNFDSPETAQQCVWMTRVLLFNPLLLLAGGVFGSRLMAKKIFFYQALQPLVYNGGIILGAVLLHMRFGIYSVAIGAVVGAIFGMFALNLAGARSIGMQWSPEYDWKHPALREWIRLSLPLMLGQSLTTLDPQIRSYFASEVKGAVATMNYSRQLFNSPMMMIGPAAGAASLPFFASLWAKADVAAFSAAVNRSVSRLLSVSLLLSALMIALAYPIVDVALRRGRFHTSDASAAAELFVLFCLSLVFWTSQNLYARAFYGAGNTLTPMISGTIVTVVSLPVYWFLFHADGMRGLVIASDIGIAAHMISLAVLLHRKRMVSLADLQWLELGKALLAAMASGFATSFVLRVLPLGESHGANIVRLVAGSAVWLIVALGLLTAMKSSLPAAVLRRKSANVQPPVRINATDAPDQN
ncbi:putative membrane protein, putative virulence factor [Terriglobus roseus DSM 18391]|uniref:Putative membrane protein, putative virulence factor n=2 Tax=Terriglobus roseus TaxID=392734 RepID=I3ZM28_TERRK|nr:putative membrane protein, putative virulence factor [Terriglobus roseus DSM 18391]